MKVQIVIDDKQLDGEGKEIDNVSIQLGVRVVERLVNKIAPFLIRRADDYIKDEVEKEVAKRKKGK